MTLAPDPVVLDVSPEGVAVVLMNRPAKRNAMDELMIAGLADAFETLKGADHVRIVFLKGAGEAFSAGGDIESMRRQGERSREDNEADALQFARMLKALHDLPQFTVALINGAALGGAGGLAAACDWAVATKSAQFRFAEVRLGMVPAVISPYVIEAIGARHTRALFASALPFGAEDARRYGLVQTIVDDEAALEAEMKKLAGLAFENAPGAVREAKAAVRAVAGHAIDDHIAKDTAKRTARQRAGEEAQEGLAAFIERRKARWDV